jgi:peptide/nickel transport system permease protein
MSCSILESGTDVTNIEQPRFAEQIDAGLAVPRRGVLRRYPMVGIGVVIFILVLTITLSAPWLATHDPQDIDPTARLRAPSFEHLLGTDALGRDVWSRTLYGGRISLMVGLAVGLLASVIGLMVGLVSGYSRFADAIVMRVMDGLMSIPAILLAIALMSVTRASIFTVIAAITVVEIPRVVRLVRSVVLTLREQTYIEAAVIVGTRPARIVRRHILPNTMAPLIVQTTYICAAAMLVESILSFLGAGTPPEVPSWGNIMAEGRTFFQIAPWLILSPGLLLGLTVLAVNLVGDGLRGMLDPRIARRM